MGHPGYIWSLVAEAGRWRWRALDRDRGTIMMEGVAGSRAEAAARLAHGMTLGVLGALRDKPAA